MSNLPRRGRVDRRIALEESDRLEHEADIADGHDRPALRPRQMQMGEGVPDDDVGVGREDRFGVKGVGSVFTEIGPLNPC